MTLPNGPTTPIGVGGPTPSLVSRGSEEEGKMRIPTGGPPNSQEGGGPTSSPIPGGRGGPTSNSRGSDEAPLIRGGDEELSLTQQEREAPPLNRGDREKPSPIRRRRDEPPHTQKEKRRDEGRKEGSLQDRPNNRHNGPTRAGNFVC